MRLVTYQHAEDRHPAPLTLELEELFTLLGEHDETDCHPCPGGMKCPQKNGTAWSPGFIPSGKTRLGGNVESLDVAVFDLDHLTTAQLEPVLDRLEGLELLIHSSHSHKPPNDNCLRVVFALSRPVLRKEWLPFWHSVVRKYDLPADKKAKDPSRIYFFPRRPRGNPFINVRGEGAPLDVDALLVQNILDARQAKAVQAQQISSLEPGSTDLGSLRRFLHGYNPPDDFDGAKKELVRRVLAAEPLADKGARDDSVHRAATIVGLLMPLDTPVEAAMELLRPSISKIPGYEGDEKHENFDGWLEKAAYSYGKASKKKYEEAASRNVLLALARSRSTKPPAPREAPASPVSDEDEPAPESPANPHSWRLQLRTRTLKNGEPVMEQMGVNVSIILEKHPEWAGALKFNEVTKDIECKGGPLPESECCATQLHTATENWLQLQEGLNLPTRVVESQLLFVARKHSYNPLEEYLLGCKWDNKLRLDMWLEEYCGASTTGLGGSSDISEYVRAVSAMWMIAAVARALRPGCKADNVMVLEGNQGKLKSTALNVLAGEFFTDALKDIHNKDSRMLAAQAWVIEIAELSAIRQAEVESMKSFFSAKSDQFRPPYGRRVETFPRRCIFAGTTNETTYLRDDTGNRRFWPIDCSGTIDIDALRRDRDQLWGEAVARFQAGERWWFDADGNNYLEQITGHRLRGEAEAEFILDWWLRIDPANRPESVKLHEVAADALDIPKFDIEKRSGTVGRALKKAGFERVQRRDGDRRYWVYVPSPELLTSKKRFPRGRYLALVANAEVPA